MALHRLKKLLTHRESLCTQDFVSCLMSLTSTYIDSGLKRIHVIAHKMLYEDLCTLSEDSGMSVCNIDFLEHCSSLVRCPFCCNFPPVIL